MRLLYIFILISCFSFSQTNEVLVNQAEALENPISELMKDNVKKALEL